jgi:peptidoglycan/xylan/chitin deacetylase (PgdA/CDA1 family)
MPKQAINPAMRDGLAKVLPSKQALVSPSRTLRSGVIQRSSPRFTAASVMRVATSRKPVVLIYHDVPSIAGNHSVDLRTFESHITFMKRHFDFIAPQQLKEKRHALSRIRVLLTFDDGFRNQFELAKRVLLNHSVPALFFISSRHSSAGAYLWFAYERMLAGHFQGEGFSFRGTYFSMRPEHRVESMGRLRAVLLDLKPHPSAMYRAIEQELPPVNEMIDRKVATDRYQGMSADEVADLAREPQFTIGCHTVDHPLLTRCTYQEAYRQIADNRAWLERVSKRKCATIAYPGGDYNAQIINLCRDLALTDGFAEIPKLRSIPQFEVPRIGVYSASVFFLGCKVKWGNLLRKTNLPFG